MVPGRYAVRATDNKLINIYSYFSPSERIGGEGSNMKIIIINKTNISSTKNDFIVILPS